MLLMISWDAGIHAEDRSVAAEVEEEEEETAAGITTTTAGEALRVCAMLLLVLNEETK